MAEKLLEIRTYEEDILAFIIKKSAVNDRLRQKEEP
jgi:hypothetical protein